MAMGSVVIPVAMGGCVAGTGIFALLAERRTA
jgi:hypothetical protein